MPRCPKNMSEPEYAALLFMKTCTSERMVSYVDQRPRPNRIFTYGRGFVLHAGTPTHRPRKAEESETHGMKNSVYALRRDVDNIIDIRSQFLQARERKQLEKWENCTRENVVLTRLMSNLIIEYLDGVEAAHQEELNEIKRKRQEEITQRLERLGWTDDDMNFYQGDNKAWRALVGVPKPLTEKIWKNLLPKLTPILEENRERNNIYNAEKRRIERRAYVDQFIMNMRYNEHPFASILQELGVGVPPAPNLGLLAARPLSGLDRRFLMGLKSSLALENPFPKTQTALRWDCLNDLSEVDMSIQEVEAKLEERREQIQANVFEWRQEVESRLVKQLRFENGEAGDEVVLLVNGSTNSSASLSPNTRLLLRADTIFISPFSGHDCLHESADFPYSEDEEETRLDNFARDLETEWLVKLLLRDLEMPDVAYIELQEMGRRFTCGRCSYKVAKSWDEMVVHYTQELDVWNEQENCQSAYSLRYPVVYRNPHDLKPTENSQSLVLALTEAPGKVSEVAGSFSRHCYLCEATGRSASALPVRILFGHLQDCHDITGPVEYIHYGAQYHDGLGDTWHKKWDGYHDQLRSAREVSSTSANV
ncbi:hypothetical protein RhiLY_12326 [Ceratobasidium sp. AG-Ba]|nr:hypothetical protein RhiLY_12326 [Ceratobasidium sp. AG-Ba]